MQLKAPNLLIFLIVLLTNILFSFIDIDIDLTEDKKHSISSETIEILRNLNDNVFIKVYLDGEFPAEFKHLQIEIINLLNSFKSIANDNVNFEFVNPNESEDEKQRMEHFKQLINAGLAPTDIEIRRAGSNLNQIIFPGALIYYQNKQLPINFLKNSVTKQASDNINASIENLEFEFISAIHQIVKNKTERIAFLEGNGELDEKQVYDITHSVMQDNKSLSYHYNIERFNIKEFLIDSTRMQADITAQISRMSAFKVIIIAKPIIPFNKLDKFLIDQYIMNGGKVLWLIDGVNASMDSLRFSKSFIALKNNLNIDDQLFKYGARINANLIEDLRSIEIPIVTGYSNNIPQQTFLPWPYSPLLFSENTHPISKGLDAIKLDFVSSIDTIKNQIKKTILLHSSKQARLNTAPSKISLNILENPPPLSSFNKNFIPIAVLLEGEFESVFNNRILPRNGNIEFKKKSLKTQMIIIADGDIIKNNVNQNGDIFPLAYDRFIKYTYPGNKTFIMNAIHYLCDDIGLASLKSKEIRMRLLDKKKIKETKLAIQLLNIFLPLVFLFIFALFFLKSKKNKYA